MGNSIDLEPVDGDLKHELDELNEEFALYDQRLKEIEAAQNAIFGTAPTLIGRARWFLADRIIQPLALRVCPAWFRSAQLHAIRYPEEERLDRALSFIGGSDDNSLAAPLTPHTRFLEKFTSKIWRLRLLAYSPLQKLAWKICPEPHKTRLRAIDRVGQDEWNAAMGEFISASQRDRSPDK